MSSGRSSGRQPLSTTMRRTSTPVEARTAATQSRRYGSSLQARTTTPTVGAHGSISCTRATSAAEHERGRDELPDGRSRHRRGREQPDDEERDQPREPGERGGVRPAGGHQLRLRRPAPARPARWTARAAPATPSAAARSSRRPGSPPRAPQPPPARPTAARPRRPRRRAARGVRPPPASRGSSMAWTVGNSSTGARTITAAVVNPRRAPGRP